jgi:hypothetical protein
MAAKADSWRAAKGNGRVPSLRSTALSDATCLSLPLLSIFTGTGKTRLCRTPAVQRQAAGKTEAT